MLILKWGESTMEQCQIAYVLAPQIEGVKQTQFERFSAPCTPFGESSHNVPSWTSTSGKYLVGTIFNSRKHKKELIHDDQFR